MDRDGSLSDVQAVVLAGGLGTRLRAAVADRPKVLAPIHGRPWVTFLLNQLADAGVRHVVMLTGFKADQVQNALGDDYRGMRLVYAQESTPLGTAGAVRAALPLLTSPAILLLNGDSYCAADLADLREFHGRREADLTIVVARSPDASRFGTVRAQEDGRVVGFEEKTQSAGGWINAGIYLLATTLIAEIAPHRHVSLEKEMFPAWIARKAFYAFHTDGRFLDIGTPESYAQATAFFES